MDLTIDGHTYALSTGGYESAIPTDSIHELGDATHQTRSFRAGFPAEELDIADIFNCEICTGEPQFAVQFGRTDEANDHPTYQALGNGLDNLRYADDNIKELANEIEEHYEAGEDYTTHRPLIRAHTTLYDNSVLYAEVYYHGYSTESVKHFELVTFHPQIPFNTDRYDEIYSSSPVNPPSYIEEIKMTTKSDFPVLNHSPASISETDAFRAGVPDICRVENLFRRLREPMQSPWDVFESPRQLYADSYVHGSSDKEPEVTSVRAASPETIESVFYQIEVS